MSEVMTRPAAGWERIRGDIAGGFSAAIIALPLALGFGVACFAPLGPDYTAAGALAGLYGAVFTGIFAALLGGTPAQISGPTGPMAVVMTATLADLTTRVGPGGEPDPTRALNLLFLTVLLGGVFQILLGAVRAGRAIQYIPSTVIAGFMNGIAVIIFLGQVAPILGIAGGSLRGHFDPVLPVMATGAITIGAIYAARRWVRTIPPTLTGLVAGTLAYQLIGRLWAPEILATTGNPWIIGEIPSAVPVPRQLLEFPGLLTGLDADTLRTIVPAALVLGVLGSIDSLLTSLVADVATRTRHRSNRELIGQGIGNVLAASFGGIGGAGATVRTLVNVDAGGRGRLSGVTHGLVLLAILLFLGSVAGWIPMSVLAGILIVTSIGMLDTWSLSLIRHRTAWQDLAVVLLVTGVTVAVDLMVAVGVGVAVTMVLFIRALSAQSVVRRRYRCELRRSRHARPDADERIIAAAGARTLVYELDGNLFFGSTSSLAADIEPELPTVDYLVLDLGGVRTIDMSGAELIKRIANAAQDHGSRLLLSSLARNPHRRQMASYLEELGVIDQVGECHVLPSLDAALEFTEDRVLARAGHDDRATAEVALRRCTLFEDLDDEQLARIEERLARRTAAAGEVIFERSELSDYLGVVTRGHVNAYSGDSKHRGERLSTIGPGLHFAAATPAEAAPADTDELGIASEFHGEALRLVRGTTLPVHMVADAMIALGLADPDRAHAVLAEHPQAALGARAARLGGAQAQGEQRVQGRRLGVQEQQRPQRILGQELPVEDLEVAPGDLHAEPDRVRGEGRRREEPERRGEAGASEEARPLPRGHEADLPPPNSEK